MDMTYLLTVTVDDLAVIGGALGVLPYGEVAGLMSRLLEQIKAQDTQRDTQPAEAA